MFRMTFIDRKGERREVDAPDGVSLLEIARSNGIDLEGACEGEMACSTCHVIVEPEWFAKLPAAGEEEEDTLNMAFALTKTSRLGCQITMCRDLDGMVVRLPTVHRNMLLGA